MRKKDRADQRSCVELTHKPLIAARAALIRSPRNPTPTGALTLVECSVCGFEECSERLCDLSHKTRLEISGPQVLATATLVCSESDVHHARGRQWSDIIDQQQVRCPHGYYRGIVATGSNISHVRISAAGLPAARSFARAV